MQHAYIKYLQYWDIVFEKDIVGIEIFLLGKVHFMSQKQNKWKIHKGNVKKWEKFIYTVKKYNIRHYVKCF